ncbi:hypothetical protein Vqi01_19230 [Micromonospora qiuiae]|uniref:Uncharacterized protein n=1 Tax=Micromonospora qiuiae TaxID=502268 RepID=A0ABQ4J9B5_9ACTN|nr:hypothetical protein [Micromonospora qiuiae]GIJ26761.1 hypothetical protein Vqi01_19230 [Micromonospora qiuiae]
MEDQLVLAVTTTLATKGAEALASGARTATGALVRLVRSRFRRGTREGDTLTATMEHPHEQSHQAALASFLAAEMARDPAFDLAVRTAWRRLSNPTDETHQHNVVNNFSGAADRVVQAHDIRGDINF